MSSLFFFLIAGSGQQSVTGVTSVDDSNSYWRIRGKTATVCERGTPIRCGQPIRLTHVNTGRNLHSHHFTSPLSGNQVRCILWAMAALQNITQLSCLKSWFLSLFFSRCQCSLLCRPGELPLSHKCEGNCFWSKWRNYM